MGWQKASIDTDERRGATLVDAHGSGKWGLSHEVVTPLLNLLLYARTLCFCIFDVSPYCGNIGSMRN